jgi:5-methylcytosine-specific restriction enzyme subunit McrC
MKIRKNIIQVFEHQTLRVDAGSAFKPSHFRSLELYGYKTKEKYYSVGNQRIKFSNFVGVIQVDNLTIEILPKADNNEADTEGKNKWHEALITMLQECKLIKLESLSNAKLKLKSASILDLYFDVFLTETERLVRQGLTKSYRTISENLTKIKGRIQFTEHVRRNYIHKEKVFVEHQTYDVNNKLNQILLKALEVLSDLTNNPSFDIRIKKLLLDFERVEKATISSSSFESLSFNRNTERYKQAITLAKLIILQYNPDLKGGKENVLAILFDMNILYENYIYRKLKVLERQADCNITKVGRQNRRPFWETRGIRADIIIESKGGNFVIDTKWKVLKENKPADDDLRQMFVYNLHYGSDLSILLYPKTSVITSPKKPYQHLGFRDKYCQVAFVDLFKKDGKLEKDLGRMLYDQLLKGEI